MVAAWQVAAPLLLGVKLALTLPMIGVRLDDFAHALLPAIVGCGLMAVVMSLLDGWPSALPAPLRLVLLAAARAVAYGAALLLLWPAVVLRAWAMVTRRRSKPAAA